VLKKVLITILVIGVLAITVRVLIKPAVVPNLAVSPAIGQEETVLINRAERFAGARLQRFELIGILPPFVDGRSYEPDDSPAGIVVDLTGIPVADAPIVEYRRVIALPGETVVARKDLGIFVDGKLLDERSYTKDLPKCDLFVLADITRQSAESGFLQSYQNSDAPIVVPPDMVFVLADNREFPGSEKWGFLSQKRVVGKVSYKIAGNGLTEIKTPALVFATEKIAINDDGVRALEKGEFTKAIHLFKSALAIDNNFELARDNLSIAYNNFAIKSADKPDVALDSLHKALFLDPDNELTKTNLAGMLKRLGMNENNYKDRVALAEQAAKKGKNISALVEYRAAVKLDPNPSILAKVSQLEQQCNFPAHAIPEDLVTATADSTKQDVSELLPKSTNFVETRMDSNVTNNDSKPVENASKAKKTALEPNRPAEKPTAATAEKMTPATTTDKTKTATTTEKTLTEKTPTEAPTAKTTAATNTAETKVAATNTAATKTAATKVAATKTAEVKTAKQKTAKENHTDKKTASTKSATDEFRVIPVEELVGKQDDLEHRAPEVISDVTSQTVLESKPLKKQSTGFDIGAFMQNIVSAISPKSQNSTGNVNSSERNQLGSEQSGRSTDTTGGASDYRGPPLLKHP